MMLFSGSTGGQYTSLSSSSLVNKCCWSQSWSCWCWYWSCWSDHDPDHVDLIMILIMILIMLIWSWSWSCWSGPDPDHADHADPDHDADPDPDHAYADPDHADADPDHADLMLLLLRTMMMALRLLISLFSSKCWHIIQFWLLYTKKGGFHSFLITLYKQSGFFIQMWLLFIIMVGFSFSFDYFA